MKDSSLKNADAGLNLTGHERRNTSYRDLEFWLTLRDCKNVSSFKYFQFRMRNLPYPTLSTENKVLATDLDIHLITMSSASLSSWRFDLSFTSRRTWNFWKMEMTVPHIILGYLLLGLVYTQTQNETALPSANNQEQQVQQRQLSSTTPEENDPNGRKFTVWPS